MFKYMGKEDDIKIEGVLFKNVVSMISAGIPFARVLVTAVWFVSPPIT